MHNNWFVATVIDSTLEDIVCESTLHVNDADMLEMRCEGRTWKGLIQEGGLFILK